ncbi:hypothetical protein [Kumtagia ephedrae]|uniref:Uncharacterized protein n=1 Tax=Kumtagia ephedrae TaxID=2116701 RepID=A0A2P7RNE1_9HYPH|nr:hypothetical protein [Mesorhizobium ephedrae]PSJ51738.1 hypothetical protein C7I84_27040 [Mesorhizobium ephedrae]
MSGLSKAAQWALPVSILVATGVFATMFRYEVHADMPSRLFFVQDRWNASVSLCGGSKCLPFLAGGMEVIRKADVADAKASEELNRLLKQ